MISSIPYIALDSSFILKPLINDGNVCKFESTCKRLNEINTARVRLIACIAKEVERKARNQQGMNGELERGLSSLSQIGDRTYTSFKAEDRPRYDLFLREAYELGISMDKRRYSSGESLRDLFPPSHFGLSNPDRHFAAYCLVKSSSAPVIAATRDVLIKSVAQFLYCKHQEEFTKINKNTKPISFVSTMDELEGYINTAAQKLFHTNPVALNAPSNLLLE